MNDLITDAFYVAVESLFPEVDNALESFLDDLSPEDLRDYARFGVIAAIEEVIKHKHMED